MANRGMSAAMLAEIAKDQVREVYLVSIAFDGGTQYYTTHASDLSWSSQTWEASGSFLDISDITEHADPKINNATVTLSGAEQANISAALTEDYTDRELNVYIGFLDSSDALIVDPVNIFSGRIDSFSYQENPERGSATLRWKAANHFADFDRQNGRLANDKSHQVYFPGDDFFKFTSEVTRTITWGRVRYGEQIPDWLWRLYRDNDYQLPGPSAFEGGQFHNPGVDVEVIDTVAPIPVIYGERRIGGIRSFVGVSDTNGTDLYIVHTLCEGEINDVPEIYLDDVLSTDSRWDDPDNPGSSLVQTTVHTGSDSQAADTDLVNDITDWTSSQQGKGTAYVVTKLSYHPDVFDRVPEFKFVVQGKLLFDTRTSTTGYSNNPALCVYDYLTDSRYGKGLPASAVAGIDDAADDCEVTQPSAPVTQDMFACDAVVETDNSILDNLKLLLGTCRGLLPYFGGQYNLIVEQDETSTFSFNEANIVGGWNFHTEGIRDRYNRVEAKFVNPSRSWKEDIGAVDSSTYRTADNGRMLKKRFSMPFTTDVYRAQDQAELVMNKSRQQLRTGFDSDISALEVEPGRVVDVTHESPGWSAKTYRVKSVTFHPGRDVPLSFEFEEHEPNVYSMTARSTEANAPDTNLPNPNSVAAPTGLSLSTVTVKGSAGANVSSIKVDWTAADDAYVIGYELQYRENGAANYDKDTIQIAGKSSTTGYIFNIQDGVAYDVRVRSVNAIQKHSSWVEELNYTVAAGGNIVLGSNNDIKTSDTVGEVTNGEGTTYENTGIKGYDSSGNLKTHIKATTGIIEATDVNLTGTITATAGAIGGWTVNSTEMTKGDVSIDSANEWIQVGPDASNYVRMSGSGIVGVNAVLGQVFHLPTTGNTVSGTDISFSGNTLTSTTTDLSGFVDGEYITVDGSTSNDGSYKVNGAPTGTSLTVYESLTTESAGASVSLTNLKPSFIGGVIKDVNVELYSKSVIRTSDNVGDGSASSAGVLINDTGLKAYGTNSSSPSVHIDATSGEVTAITFTTTSGSGKRIEVNPSGDNEIHFYGDRGDTTVEELATIGIKTSGSDTIIGYFGSSNSSRVAVYGESDDSIGVWGTGNSAGSVGVRGTAPIGVYANTATTGGYALIADSASWGIPIKIVGGDLDSGADNGSLDFASNRLKVRSSGSWKSVAHTDDSFTTPADSVGQSEIKEAVQTISGSGSAQGAAVKTGGRYCFLPTFSAGSGSGTDEVFFADGVSNVRDTGITGSAGYLSGSGINLNYLELAEAHYDDWGRSSEKSYFFYSANTDDAYTFRLPYINSSPPYDPFGLGPMMDFVYALIDNATGTIEQVCNSPDPPWVYNGPTPIAPRERLRKWMRERAKLPTLSKSPTAQELAAYRAAVESYDEPTQAEIKAVLNSKPTESEKNADMDLIPHPWVGNNFGPGGNMEGKTIVLIAGSMADALTKAKQAGDEIADILLRGYITLDNKNIAGASRYLSDGMLVGARWKLSS